MAERIWGRYTEYPGSCLIMLGYLKPGTISGDKMLGYLVELIERIEEESNLPCSSVIFLTTKASIEGNESETDICGHFLPEKPYVLVRIMQKIEQAKIDDVVCQNQNTNMIVLAAELRCLYHAFEPSQDAMQRNKLLMQKILGVQPSWQISEDMCKMIGLLHGDAEIGNVKRKYTEADRFACAFGCHESMELNLEQLAVLARPRVDVRPMLPELFAAYMAKIIK
jgi:hypothetical protein